MVFKEILNSFKKKTIVSGDVGGVSETQQIKIDLNNLQFRDFQWTLGERESIDINNGELNITSYFHDTGSTSYSGDTQTIDCDELSFISPNDNILKDLITDSLTQTGKAEKIYLNIPRRYYLEYREDGCGRLEEYSWDKSGNVNVKVESTIVENTGNVELTFSISQPDSQDEWKKYLSTTGTYKNEGYVFKLEQIPAVRQEVLDLLLKEPTGRLDECKVKPENYSPYLKLDGDNCMVVTRNTFYNHDLWEHPPSFDEETQEYCQFPVAELQEALAQLQTTSVLTEPGINLISNEQTEKSIQATFVSCRTYTGGQNYVEGDPNNIKTDEEKAEVKLAISYSVRTQIDNGFYSRPEKTFTTARMVITRGKSEVPYAVVERQDIHQDPTPSPEWTPLGFF